MLKNGVEPMLARCCISHGKWETMECSLEELLIALSDNLWKGKRVEELEIKVIDAVSSLIGKERWDIYAKMDSIFENIASDGYQRLRRSMGG